MARTDTLSNFLTDIAIAIRKKTNTTAAIKAANFDEEIKKITSLNSDIEEIIRTNRYGTGLFFQCSNMTKCPNIDASNITNFKSMFHYCSKITEIDIDTSSGEIFTNAFSNCSALKTISTLDLSKATNLTNIFYASYNLEYIGFVPNCIKNSINISNTNKLSTAGIKRIIEGLDTVSSPKTISLSNTVKSKLSTEQLQTISDKGWTLS